MLVRASHKRELDSFARVRLFLPPKQEPVEILGRIASKVHVAGREALGIHFIDFPSEEKEKWMEYLKRIEALASDTVEATTTPEEYLERRTSRRFATAFMVRFASSDGLDEFVTQNVSSGGMFLATSMEKPTGEQVRIVMVHPVTDKTFEIDAEVVRQEEGFSGGLMGIALRFLNLTPQREERLKTFVDLPEEESEEEAKPTEDLETPPADETPKAEEPTEEHPDLDLATKDTLEDPEAPPAEESSEKPDTVKLSETVEISESIQSLDLSGDIEIPDLEQKSSSEEEPNTIELSETGDTSDASELPASLQENVLEPSEPVKEASSEESPDTVELSEPADLPEPAERPEASEEPAADEAFQLDDSLHASDAQELLEKAAAEVAKEQEISETEEKVADEAFEFDDSLNALEAPELHQEETDTPKPEDTAAEAETPDSISEEKKED